MYVNTSQNESQGIVVPFYHARNSYRKITCDQAFFVEREKEKISKYREGGYDRRLTARFVQIPSKKKKRSCPFSSATARRRKAKKFFSSHWA